MTRGDLILGHFLGRTDDSLATPFELWCEQQGVRPDHPGAWDAFSLLTARADSTAHPIAG